MGTGIYLFFAQEPDLDKVEQGLGLLERIQAGGVPLIALIVAVACGAFAYWQLRRNNELQAARVAEAEAREKAQKAEAKAREEAQEAATKIRLAEQESLLREMLDRDREAQEGTLAMAKALEGLTAASQDIRREVGDVLRRLDVLERRSS